MSKYQEKKKEIICILSVGTDHILIVGSLNEINIVKKKKLIQINV